MNTFKDYLEEYREIPHYYGDVVRAALLTTSMIMLISLPFFKYLIPTPILISVLAILAFGFLAGLTNPKVIWVIVFDSIASMLGFVVFEYIALTYFNEHIFFALVNQLLAIIFFIAIYYSTKTLRGFILRQKDNK